MKSYSIIVSLLLICFSSNAQKQNTKDLEEVTVESFFFDQKITSSTSPIGVVTAEAIDDIPLQNMSDALRLEPAISVKSDGPWATAPSIRGLSGQRVIVAVDGNRIETATDVSGGMNMINMHDVQKIEIIKSGASSIYGSGAIGGVINFITQPIVYSSTPAFNAAVSSSYQSVNNMVDEYIRLSASNKKYFFSLSGSFRNADDVNTPIGKIENSQFKDYSVNAKAGYRINNQHEIRVQHQNFQARDVGVPGGDTFTEGFTVTFPEHSRIMTDVQYRFTDVTNELDLLKVKLYQQYINRDVYVETNKPMYKGAPIAIDPGATHNLWGGLLQTDWTVNKQRITAGVDIWQRNISSSRTKYVSQEDSSMMVRTEQPLPDASYMSNGIFARTERQFFDDKLNTTLGLRYDYIIVNTDEVYDPISVEKDGVPLNVARRLTIEEGKETKQSWSTNLGANYEISKGLNVALSGGHSFRAPNIEEMYKYLDLGSTVEIGNPDLKPEESNFIDLGLHYNNDQLSISVNGFLSSIDNLIAEEAGETTYDNYDNDGNVSSTDTLAALILNNIDKALLYGFDASINYQALPQLDVFANIAYTIGENKSDGGYLPQIAPMRGLAGFKYSAYKYLHGGIELEWAAKQDKIAEGETTTDAYAIINLKLNTPKISFDKVDIQAFAGVGNILNTEYSNHLSTNRASVRVEPGRNFYVKVKLSLNGGKKQNMTIKDRTGSQL